MNTEDTVADPSERETCVVCGNSVEPRRGAACINHRGNTITVCGSQCLRTFAKEPDAYLARLAKLMRDRTTKTEMTCS